MSQTLPPAVVNLKFGPLLDTRLRVVTWNLWGRGGPFEARLDAIAATLDDVAADLVALQEVWEETGGRSQAEVLAAALGFHWAFASRYAIDGVAVGNAVLSRWPIAGFEVRSLPAPPELEELRNAVRVDVDGPRGRLHVFTTHLNWRFDQSAIRQEQVTALARFVAEGPDAAMPPILAGDFNAAPDSDEIRMLTGRAAVPVPGTAFQDAWEIAGDGGPGHTWVNANPWARADLEPDRRIDYVFAGFPRLGGAGHVTACRLAGTPVGALWPSDHLAVVAELRY